MEGRRLGRYRITSKLAEGGMGAVYLATHELMGREVVIKVLLPEMSTQRDIVQRFFNEAQATGNLNHPGIVAIFDLDYGDDGRAYIVMERLQGETLEQRLRRVKRLSVEHTIDVVKQLASAVGAAHGKGVVHRDLKPANIFLVPDPEVPGRERVKVLDFGVAKLALQQSSVVTHAGSLMGTAAYMAPEQCKDSASVDSRADLYALGCIVYSCLCGRSPFVGGTIEVLAALLRDVPPPPRALDPSLPPWLDNLVMWLLEKDPNRRVQSCTALTQALDDGRQRLTAGPHANIPHYQTARAPVEHMHPQHIAAGHEARQLGPAQHLPMQRAGSSTVSMANTAATLPGSKSRHTRPAVWFGTGGAVLAVVGLVVYLGLGLDQRSPGTLPQAQEQGLAPNPAASEISNAKHMKIAAEDPGNGLGQGENEPAAAEPRQAASTATDDAVQALLEEAQSALKNKDWSLAAARAQEVLPLAPGHAAAREIVANAEQEQANALLSRGLDDALRNGDFEKAESRLAALPETSVYRQPAKAKLDRARDKHKTALLDAISQAETWRDAGKCDDIQALKAAWFEIEEQLEPIREQCVQAQMQARSRAASNANAARSTPASSAPPSPTRVSSVPASSGTERKPASSDNGFNQLLSQAQEAMKRRSYSTAWRLCKQVLEIQPKDPRALEVCTSAACNLGNAAGARNYYFMMPPGPQQNQLRRLCWSKSIQLGR